MQKFILNMPEYRYKDCIKELLELDKTDKEVELEYDLKFLTPFIGLVVASYFNHHKFKVKSTISPECESASYAKNNNFFHFTESSTNYDERNNNYSGKYTPIMKTLLDGYFRGPKNTVEIIAKKISKVLSCNNNEIESIFTFVVSELFRNIPEHSHSFEGWHCSQFWDHENYREVEVAIVDYGIGFKESLNFKDNRKKVATDIEAMEQALKPGITSGITEKSHLREEEEEEYLNSGYGLFIITELCKIFNGEVVIISKSAIKTNSKIESLENKLVFPGTAIKIKLQIDNDMTGSKFKEILKKIVDEGEKKAKIIPGAIVKASSKSKGYLL